MKILVLGVTGMLGSTVLRTLYDNGNFDVWGTLRDKAGLRHFPLKIHTQLIHNLDVLDDNALIQVFERTNPNVVINCVGLIKQLKSANDPMVILPINSILPHRLSKLCLQYNSRLIHISTDCVFSGRKGLYCETDISDAEDLYGKSKFIGEITQCAQAITLRTSIIGHELNTNYALVNWFISQKKSVKGYKNAIFSGLPTVELARVIMNFVIPRPDLSGLFHVASNPVNKYDLLKLIAEIYGKKTRLILDDGFCIDRSLDAKKFENATGYLAPNWHQLVQLMYESYNLFKET